MKSASPKFPLFLALWFAAAAMAAAILGIILPVEAGMVRGAIGAVAALAALGALACILQARKAPLRPELAVLTPLLEADDGARMVTGEGGAVIARNALAREWFRDSSLLAYIESNVAPDVGLELGVDLVARLRQAGELGFRFTVEMPLVARDGGPEPEWYSVGVRPVAGLPGLMLWSAVEITARRTITDVLSQERQDLADFLDFLPTGLYSADVDGKFRFVNQRLAAWLGYGADELTGHSLDEVIVGPARPQDDGEWQGEVQFKTRGGEVFHALVLQSAYDDAGHSRTRTLVIRDGARREVNAAPGRIAYERFRSLFNAAPVAIAITDPEGVIADCNRAFEKLTNHDRAALIGGTLIDRLVLDDRRTFGTELERVLAGESEGTHLDLSVQGDGEAVLQTSVFVGPLSSADTSGTSEIVGAVVHFIDVTEQKNLEVQFAQAQKMQAMGQLAGGVAHDFNNLLTAMIGFCDLLLQRHAAGDPSFADIMQIKQNANRAANLVRQLLAFSRKQPLQPKDLNVTDALMEMSHLLTRLIGESIEFKLIHGRDLGVVRVDPGQFDQMIINLAVNARDAMPGGGTLTITTGTETLETPTKVGAEQVPAGRYVRVSVADTGKGIPPENLGRIFEPFFSTKKEIPGAGTGLGLATVYGIVRQTGGFIHVDSAVGKGANFTLYLPRAAESEVAAAQTKTPASSKIPEPTSEADTAGHGNILLVEDEDAVRVFAARALKNKGYKVIEARTGEQALDILRDTPAVDLMITDMMMPGMDGGTLARLIRVERPEIRIIVISGYSEEVARGDIVDTADFHFLPKPFSLSQLASKVKDVLTEA